MKKKIVAILRVALPVGLIVWLCVRAKQSDPEIFSRLWENDKDWGRLGLAVLLIFAANLVAFVRWHLLLRTVGISISLLSTLRLGFLGFLFGFVAPGQLGGDLFKAVFVAREQRRQRAAAVATILIDRACGLYGLLLVTTVGLIVSGIAADHAVVKIIADATYVLTAVGAIAIAVVLTPAMTQNRLVLLIGSLPLVGRHFLRVMKATRLFQQQKLSLVGIGFISVIVHVLNAAGLYIGARGIYPDSPTLVEHLVISPLAGVAGALPLFPGGAGSYEAAVKLMYDVFSADHAQGRGVVVGLMYRFATIVVASVGLVFYWTNRDEVSDVMELAKSEVAQAD